MKLASPKSFFKLLFVVLLMPSFSYAKTPFQCDEKSLRKAPQEIYLNAKNKSYWLAVTPQAIELFQKLGFSKVTAKPKEKIKLQNIKSCPPKVVFQKFYTAKKFDFMLIASNSCQEELTRSLDMIPAKKLENWGSMESGGNYNWTLVNVCTDGKSFVSCMNISTESEKCLGRLLE